MMSDDNKPELEWKLPTHETLRVSAMIYDTQSQSTTTQDLGTIRVPIDWSLYEDRWVPPKATLHPPILGCDCEDCAEHWSNDPDPHPPMRDCGCVLQCKPYFDVRDQYVPQHAYYASTSEIDPIVAESLRKFGLQIQNHAGAGEKLVKAVEEYLASVKDNPMVPATRIVSTQPGLPGETTMIFETRDPCVIAAIQRLAR
jgi:hypothetical protein